MNNAVFDTKIIESAISIEKQDSYNAIINRTGHYLIAGFIISSIIQFILLNKLGEPIINKDVSENLILNSIKVLK